MSDEKVLTIQERIALRRQAAATRNGAVADPPVADPPQEVAPVQPAARTRRTEPVPPPPLPPVEDAIPPAPAEPRTRRRIIKADGTELKPAESVATDKPTEPVAEEKPAVEEKLVTKQVEPLLETRRAAGSGVILQTTPQQPAVLDDRMARVKEQAKSASQALIIGMLEHMRAGEQLLITRDGEGLWTIVIPTSVVGNYVVQATQSGEPKVERKVATGQKPRGFEQSMWTPAYKVFVEKWEKMSIEERIAMARALNLNVPGMDHPEKANKLMLNMHLSMSVQAAQGIDKYLPAYSTTEARKQAEKNARAGLPW